jgi:predicted nucleotidyltransferase
MPLYFDLTPEQIAVYRDGLRLREQKERGLLSLRRERAWDLARQATDILKETYGAEKVLAIGSLVHGLWFTHDSDIDLAAEGIAAGDHYAAIAALQDLAPDFRIDLIRLDSCQEEFYEAIMCQGQPL